MDFSKRALFTTSGGVSAEELASVDGSETTYRPPPSRPTIPNCFSFGLRNVRTIYIYEITYDSKDTATGENANLCALVFLDRIVKTYKRRITYRLSGVRGHTGAGSIQLLLPFDLCCYVSLISSIEHDAVEARKNEPIKVEIAEPRVQRADDR